MRIGIIVYSVSGHTLSVAARLQDALSVAGHAVSLERLETVGPPTVGNEQAPLKSSPAVGGVDALILATPVRGGTPAPPMLSYLEQAPALDGKRVACLVTGFFPARWGCDQTIAQLRQICEAKGATVCGAGSVRWFGPGRGQRIQRAVAELVELF